MLADDSDAALAAAIVASKLLIPSSRGCQCKRGGKPEWSAHRPACRRLDSRHEGRDHRPRLRRPAAGGRVRRGGRRRHRRRHRPAQRRAAAPAGVGRRGRRRRAPARRSRDRFTASDRARATSAPATRCRSASRRRSPTSASPISLHRRRRPRRSPASCARASSWFSSRPPTPAPRASGCGRSSRSRAWPRAASSTSRSRRSGSTRAAPTTRSAPRRRSSAGSPRPAATARVELYELVCDEVVAVSTPEAAELSKLLENIFRSVNIALVNELAILCDRMGIDIWEVSTPRRPSRTGSCASTRARDGRPLPAGRPVLPRLQGARVRLPDRVHRARRQGQPGTSRTSASTRIARALNDAGKPVKGSRVLLLGVSYKAGVGDLREAPALQIARLLRDLGAEICLPRPTRPRGRGARPALDAIGRRAGVDRPRVHRHGPSGRRLPRRSWPRRRWSSTCAASPAGSAPRTWSASSRFPTPAASRRR